MYCRYEAKILSKQEPNVKLDARILRTASKNAHFGTCFCQMEPESQIERIRTICTRWLKYLLLDGDFGSPVGKISKDFFVKFFPIPYRLPAPLASFPKALLSSKARRIDQNRVGGKRCMREPTSHQLLDPSTVQSKTCLENPSITNKVY